MAPSKTTWLNEAATLGELSELVWMAGLGEVAAIGELVGPVRLTE